MFTLEVLRIDTTQHQFSTTCFITHVSVQPKRENRFIHKLLIHHVVPEKEYKGIFKFIGVKANELVNLETSVLANKNEGEIHLPNRGNPIDRYLLEAKTENAVKLRCDKCDTRFFGGFSKYLQKKQTTQIFN